MAIGKRIKIAIREEGISIKELAEKVGVSVNTLYSVTKRDSERIDSITLERISAVLGLPVTFFKSEPPFEDLASLEIKKTALLEMIAESGYEDLGNPESFSEFPDIQWPSEGREYKCPGSAAPASRGDTDRVYPDSASGPAETASAHVSIWA